MSLRDIQVIAFDADDTLWINEPFFRQAEAEVAELLAVYLPKEEIHTRLYEMQMQNLALYGYGIKAFTLSLIEAAIAISDGAIDSSGIQQLIAIGKRMLQEPVTLLEGIETTLATLATKYRLVVATKGDLLDQQRKLERSGLASYFHHIEIVAHKTEKEYRALIQHLDIPPTAFLMVGNSLKSDIVPVLNIGAHAIHIPFHTTWAHEQYEGTIDSPLFKQVTAASELVALFSLK